MKSNLFKIFICLALLLVLNIITPEYPSNKKTNLTASLASQEKAKEEKINQEEIQKEIKEEIEKPLVLEAKSACVFDITKNEFIFEKEAGRVLPLASITKLMTALVAKENLPSSTLIEISLEALMQEGDSGLKVGETWKLSDITKVMLISSSNDAAFAIASSLRTGLEPEDSEFVKLMNKKAIELGLNKSHYYNTSGLDLSLTEAGSYGSCKDTSKLILHILKKYPDLIEITTKESVTFNGLIYENTNQLLPKFPSLFGGKTGFSDLAGGNLTVVVDRGMNHPMILTVLGSSQGGRFEDVEALYNRFVK